MRFELRKYWNSSNYLIKSFTPKLLKFEDNILFQKKFNKPKYLPIKVNFGKNRKCQKKISKIYRNL